MHAQMNGDALRSLRLAQLRTQTEVAKAAGIRTETLCRLEKGQRPAEFSTIKRLAETLNVEPAELLAVQQS